MLVSKSAITRELGNRLNEFAPPGEQLQGLFEAEHGDTPFVHPLGTPVFILLTSNYVVFVGAKKMSNKPTQTLGTVPRAAIQFGRPDNGVAHFWVEARMHDQSGQWYGVRLKVHKMWRDEATALCAAAGGGGGQQQGAYGQQGGQQQGGPQEPGAYGPSGQQQAGAYGQQGAQQPGAYPGQPSQYPQSGPHAQPGHSQPGHSQPGHPQPQQPGQYPQSGQHPQQPGQRPPRGYQ